MDPFYFDSLPLNRSHTFDNIYSTLTLKVSVCVVGVEWMYNADDGEYNINDKAPTSARHAGSSFLKCHLRVAKIWFAYLVAVIYVQHVICALLASQTRQEEGHGEVQEGQGPSQQIGRQSQEEGLLVLLRTAPSTLDIGSNLEVF